ncbi:MAG: ABC transporter permease [Thermoanaerobaculia bacterium]|nr:ABC transporter permease [Thermoanaerobaculia bacterium]
MSLRRIVSVARKELRQLARDPLTTGFVVGLPLAQLALFGYAINHDVRHVPTALLDSSNSEVSRRLVGQLEATQTFDVVVRPGNADEARRLMRDGSVQAVIEIPGDFDKLYYRGKGAELSILVDATDPTIARAVRASAQGLEGEINRRLQPFLVEGQEGTLRASTSRATFGSEEDLDRQRLVSFAVLDLFNPELRTALFVVPGLLGVILTTTMILMTALAIVRERERGTFEFLIATPVRRLELMVGKILPYIAIGAVQIVLILGAGVLLFRVPFRGSVIDLTIASVVFIAANLVLGLTISARTKTQYQATQVSFFFFLPSVLLSGFMFPFDAMPEPAQWLGEILPLTHYARLCKGILLRGATLTDQLYELGALVLFFVVGLTVATAVFKKELV